MANLFDILPCGYNPQMVTSIIQTRIFTTIGSMGLTCDGVQSLDNSSPCNVWGTALGTLSPFPCGLPPSPLPNDFDSIRIEKDTSLPLSLIALFYSSRSFYLSSPSPSLFISFEDISKPVECCISYNGYPDIVGCRSYVSLPPSLGLSSSSLSLSNPIVGWYIISFYSDEDASLTFKLTLSP